ncbi:hypothetical protein QUF88_13445 [Bacillus sp. DX1.1]|uniref:glycoside hydrolase family 78 protein n=1 Tax=Bacillus sp. DX3.1 TaxID=3052091 RepID=UPI0025712ACD|nr:hypothetical protein [Bacillus sp. DX3.1]MDM5154788.1 hypothetical protein [Bacillus sp. DX1.1]WJE83665.1 hypothetical protein QRE67_10940 [Bacillus sp. DX3.1]
MLSIKNTLCENRINPIGIDLKVVKISWQLDSKKQSVLQVAYPLQEETDQENRSRKLSI